ncbi:MAG TPA: glycosyltransferase [Candidatus Acidoferrales bacterium]|nr:glycosyltransferase [Candidatus Acidoferrales bacterium]
MSNVPPPVSEVHDCSRQHRLLFVITSSDFGGTETTLRELVLRLDPNQFKSAVCSLRPSGRIARDIAARGVRLFSLRMAERPRLAELLQGIVRLARWIDRHDVDLVQSFLYRANTLAPLAARLSRRRPLVVAGQRSLYPLGGRRAAVAARWTWGFADRVIAVSNAVRDELIRTDGLPLGRIDVVENGVDTRYFHPPRGDSVARERFGIPRDAVVVSGVGRLSPEKGFDRLVEALSIARARGLPLHLLLAGDGPHRPQLEDQVRALGLAADVTFLGMLRDLLPLYAATDILALPSLEEGLPNALLEAMSSEIAVVASRVGGVPEVVEDGVNGLLVTPGDSAGLAEAVIRLAADPTLRHRLGNQARTCTSQRFDIGSMVERHACIYRNLLTQRDHRGESPRG